MSHLFQESPSRMRTGTKRFPTPSPTRSHCPASPCPASPHVSSTSTTPASKRRKTSTPRQTTSTDFSGREREEKPKVSTTASSWCKDHVAAFAAVRESEAEISWIKAEQEGLVRKTMITGNVEKRRLKSGVDLGRINAGTRKEELHHDLTIMREGAIHARESSAQALLEARKSRAHDIEMMKLRIELARVDQLRHLPSSPGPSLYHALSHFQPHHTISSPSFSSSSSSPYLLSNGSPLAPPLDMLSTGVNAKLGMRWDLHDGQGDRMPFRNVSSG